MASEEAVLLDRLVEDILLKKAGHTQNDHGVRIIRKALKDVFDALPEMAERIQELEQQLAGGSAGTKQPSHPVPTGGKK